jgi:hypothetical protein
MGVSLTYLVVRLAARRTGENHSSVLPFRSLIGSYPFTTGQGLHESFIFLLGSVPINEFDTDKCKSI